MCGSENLYLNINLHLCQHPWKGVQTRPSRSAVSRWLNFRAQSKVAYIKVGGRPAARLSNPPLFLRPHTIMHFSRAIAFATLALPIFAAADCDTGSVQCCQSLQSVGRHKTLSEKSVLMVYQMQIGIDF